MAPSDGRKRYCRVMASRGYHRQCVLRILVREWTVAVSLLIALCVCVLVCRCAGVVYPCGVRGCLRVSPEVYLYRPPASSVESVRLRSALVVHSKEFAICTERTFAPAIIRSHDDRVVGTMVTALASHSLMCANTLLLRRRIVGNSS